MSGANEFARACMSGVFLVAGSDDIRQYDIYVMTVIYI